MKSYNYEGLTFNVFDEHTKYWINQTIDERFTKKSYEREEIAAIRRILRRDDVVLDLGASLGVTSCVVANIINNPNNLVSVEANPNLIENLRNNMELNNKNFIIKEGAVSYNNREVKFNFNGLSHSGSIYKKRHLIGEEKEVKYGKYQSVTKTTITPMDLEKEFGKKFTFLSCDIEGEEFDMMYELYSYFKDFNGMIIEFHMNRGDEKHNRAEIHSMYSKEFKITTIGATSIFERK